MEHQLYEYKLKILLWIHYPKIQLKILQLFVEKKLSRVIFLFESTSFRVLMFSKSNQENQNLSGTCSPGARADLAAHADKSCCPCHNFSWGFYPLPKASSPRASSLACSDVPLFTARTNQTPLTCTTHVPPPPQSVLPPNVNPSRRHACAYLGHTYCTQRAFIRKAIEIFRSPGWFNAEKSSFSKPKY